MTTQRKGLFFLMGGLCFEQRCLYNHKGRNNDYAIYLIIFITTEKQAVVGVAQQSEAPN